ncbi:archaea-specific SMC-related protein [Salinirubrum litoreum]|uniref:Archaea-specific SMC-related protein n=1 Tax=Salinirubrum litoreum TaxID=1126234 RepID=A0ABD5RB14_9EURY|nr:archaea-specific SMC-related protein [Salinirubrum litoreum]
MSTPDHVNDSVEFAVENIGGIDETELTLQPGVTVLSGENATNRTSFLQSVMAAMGSQNATLKGDAEEGSVRLHTDGETYERTLSRTGGDVRFSGESYLEDPDVADLFAFLLEYNEARRSVARGDDLRDVIMRPVDTDAIEAEINRLEAEKAEITDELERIESRKRDLPDLERRRNSLREKIEAERAALAEKEAEIDESGHDVRESRREQEKLESHLDDLRETRSDLESLRRQIDAREKSLRSLKQERSDLTEELEDLPETEPGAVEHLEDEIARLRTRRQTLNNDISDLQRLVQYNEERLESGDYNVLDETDAEGPDADGSVTDQLLDDEQSVVCWTCGSTVERDQITDTVDRLTSLREEKLAELSEVKTDLESLKSDKREAEDRRRRRREIENRLDEVAEELDQRTEQLEHLRERRAERTQDVERLESAVEELESDDFEEILDLHREANQLEFEVDRLESTLDDVTDEISEIEASIERAEELRADREAVVETLEDKRTKVAQIENEAVEAFNEHMAAVLDILGYDNLDRVWIERVEQQVREGRRTVEKAGFELHIVRSTENGAAYRDTVDHLSESEREVVGLVFALAGYLVHDLHETVPFMLLDSLEAIDSDRIAALVDYFADTTEFLVIALLDEDAQALDEEYDHVTAI